MSQLDEFMKQAEAVGAKEEKVLVVTGKPGSGKSKLLREAAENQFYGFCPAREKKRHLNYLWKDCPAIKAT